MKFIWCKARMAFVPRDEFFADAPRQGGPNIIRDETEPFRSMADGQTYSSKSNYRRSLKDHGVIEVGNERVETRRPEPPSAIPEILRYFDQ